MHLGVKCLQRRTIVDPKNWTTTLSRIPGRIDPVVGKVAWERNGDGSIFFIGFPRVGNIPRRQEQKKPTWRNTLRYSTTSAYSLTNPPEVPGCPSPSHPTTALEKPRSSIAQVFHCCKHTALRGICNWTFPSPP